MLLRFLLLFLGCVLFSQNTVLESFLILYENLLLIEFSGLFHCSVINVLSVYQNAVAFCFQGFHCFRNVSLLFLATFISYHVWTALSTLFLISFFVFFSAYFRQLQYFIKLTSACQVLFNKYLTLKNDGEGGSRTLAPLLTTYSLSRGAPSATWVLLQCIITLLR
jgi:hypothetical protein